MKDIKELALRVICAGVGLPCSRWPEGPQRLT